jgi:hypothetical protein
LNKNENKELKEACAKEEAEITARIEKVASILKKVPYKTESDRLESTFAFARSTLDEQEIESCVKALRSDYTAGEKGVF